jgi:TP901-1 family phage major tail protein|tara:strand:- start:213 stop:614 length:402 start_codon:yes stop_codon:yes gene_type:complete
MAFNGRQFTFDWDSTTLAGVRSRSVSISNDYVDVTNDDDAGWRALLADPSVRSVEVTISGITSDEILLAEVMKANITGEVLQADLPSTLASPGNLSGTYVVSSFEQNGDHDGAVEFSATFMSTGAIVYTASSA